jgi:hypothetical protein
MTNGPSTEPTAADYVKLYRVCIDVLEEDRYKNKVILDKLRASFRENSEIIDVAQEQMNQIKKQKKRAKSLELQQTIDDAAEKLNFAIDRIHKHQKFHNSVDNAIAQLDRILDMYMSEAVREKRAKRKQEADFYLSLTTKPRLV